MQALLLFFSFATYQNLFLESSSFLSNIWNVLFNDFVLIKPSIESHKIEKKFVRLSKGKQDNKNDKYCEFRFFCFLYFETITIMNI
jgi:hypothetical protein